MRGIRVMGLFLAAALVAAFGASSASALPEIGRCVAKEGGKYSDSACLKKVTSGGKFEFLKGTSGKKNKFTANSGEAVLEGESGTKIVCKSSTAVGKQDEDGTTNTIKGVESVISTFHECEDPGIGKICHSAGQAEGVIITNELEGELGYITKKPISVGQELHPSKKGGPFAIFECGLPASGGIKVTVQENTSGAPGSKGGGNCIISKLGEFDVMATSVKDIFKASGVGKQEPQHFENLKPKPLCNLESEFASFPAPYERSTQTELAEVVSEEPLEIKA
jgi:hypothetical protein